MAHCGLTPNKAWSGIQAVAIGQDAHSCLLRVTFPKSEIRGSSALMTAFLTEISFSSLETFNQVKHLLAE